MGLAERYLWWKAAKAMALAAPACVAVMTLSHAQPVFDLYSRRMIDLGELLYMLLLWVPLMIYLGMPMIVALAIGGAYAVAVQDREITVLNAAGMNAAQIVLPGVIAGMIGAALCASMSLYLVPVSFLEFRERSFLAEKNIGPRALRANQFNELRPGVDVYFERNLPGSMVQNVIVFVRERGSLTAITGKVAAFTRADRRLGIVLHDGFVTQTPAAPGGGIEAGVVRFETYSKELAREYSTEDLAERGLGFFERHLPQLLSPPASEKLTSEDRAGWVVEGYKRILHPLLCLAYALAALAIALGAGHGRRIGITEMVLRVIGFLVVVHPAYLVGIGVLAREPAVAPRIVLLYPVAVAAVSLYFLARLDGRQRRSARRAGRRAFAFLARGRVAAG